MADIVPYWCPCSWVCIQLNHLRDTVQSQFLMWHAGKERGRLSVCEWETQIWIQREDQEAARQRKQPQTLSRGPGSYLITGSACWERARSTTRTEGHRQPGGSQDMISTIIKAKTRGEKDSIITTWIHLSQNVTSWQGQYKFRLWFRFLYLAFGVRIEKCEWTASNTVTEKNKPIHCEWCTCTVFWVANLQFSQVALQVQGEAQVLLIGGKLFKKNTTHASKLDIAAAY